MWKWILGLGTAGAVVAVASSAGASSGPDPSKGGKGTRAGIAFEGCDHFELVDMDATKQWAVAHLVQIHFALGPDKTVDDLRADPEWAANVFFGLIFPECQSPEDATWGPERRTWQETMAEIKAQLGGMEGATDAEAAAADLAVLVLRGMAGGAAGPVVVEPPMPGPKLPPIPPPGIAGEGAPDNATGGDVLELVEAADFEAAEVQAMLEVEAGAFVQTRKTVLLGYSEGWTGATETLARMEQLAAENPDVEWIAFSFVRSRELFGLPDAPLAYVATAVDEDGVPMGEQIASTNLGVPALPNARWAALLDYARSGYPTPPGSSVEVVVEGGQAYTVLLSPPQAANSQAWGWRVWKGPRQHESKAIAHGSSLGEDNARKAAGIKIKSWPLTAVPAGG